MKLLYWREAQNFELFQPPDGLRTALLNKANQNKPCYKVLKVSFAFSKTDHLV
jgi:hypothetical protein